MSLSNLCSGKVKEIRYEDLVTHPDLTLKAMCKFLNVDFEPNMKNFNVANRTFEYEPKEFLQWKSKTLNQIDKSSAGRYKRELSEGSILAIERIASEPLRNYGYIIS